MQIDNGNLHYSIDKTFSGFALRKPRIKTDMSTTGETDKTYTYVYSRDRCG